MEATQTASDADRYARCIDISKRVRWDIDADVIRGRTLDVAQTFLPNGLSLVSELAFLNENQRRFLSQVQGRTYANMFGLVERFITAKILEVSQDHRFGDQVALEGLIRFSDEELKHQELFRRMELLAAKDMPDGYTFVPDVNEVAGVVLRKSPWSVLALTCHIEIFSLVHYKKSIEPETGLSPLWKDVFLFHWKEESQHVVMDEMEWQREDAKLKEHERDQAVTDLIDLVFAVDGILQAQSAADAEYFIATCEREFDDAEQEMLSAVILKAYRWQYIVSGIQEGRFIDMLTPKISADQLQRITTALAPLM